MPYSSALRLNRICSDNESFDKCCQDLEGWLIETGNNEKMVTWKHLPKKEKTENSEQKLTLNIN